MAQLDLDGLPVTTHRDGPAQGLLIIDTDATLAQAKARGRLQAAFDHFAAGVLLLHDTDLQQWRLPPLTLDELRAALDQIRALGRSLEQIEGLLEEGLLPAEGKHPCPEYQRYIDSLDEEE